MFCFTDFCTVFSISNCFINIRFCFTDDLSSFIYLSTVFSNIVLPTVLFYLHLPCFTDLSTVFLILFHRQLGLLYRRHVLFYQHKHCLSITYCFTEVSSDLLAIKKSKCQAGIKNCFTYNLSCFTDDISYFIKINTLSITCCFTNRTTLFCRHFFI